MEGQAGTVWWHAHITWLRATVHGAFIIKPNRHNLYPYQHILKGKIFKDEVILLGTAKILQRLELVFSSS